MSSLCVTFTSSLVCNIVSPVKGIVLPISDPPKTPISLIWILSVRGPGPDNMQGLECFQGITELWVSEQNTEYSLNVKWGKKKELLAPLWFFVFFFFPSAARGGFFPTLVTRKVLMKISLKSYFITCQLPLELTEMSLIMVCLTSKFENLISTEWEKWFWILLCFTAFYFS